MFSHPFRPAPLTTVRTPQLGRVLTGEGRVEGTTSLPSLLGHHTKEPLQFYPTQRPATLRPMEVAKNKEEGQGLSVAATLQEQPWLPVTCCAEDPSSFHPCRNEQPAHPRGPLQISFPFLPQCQMPEPLPAPSQSPGSALAARLGLCSYVSARCQPGVLHPTPSATCTLAPSPSSCALKGHQPNTGQSCS